MPGCIAARKIRRRVVGIARPNAFLFTLNLPEPF